MHTSAALDEIFVRNIKAKNLDEDGMPTAVRLALQAMSMAVISPFAGLLEELPAEARAFDWMAAMYAAYAEFCDHTVVVDDSPKATAPPAADPPAGE